MLYEPSWTILEVGRLYRPRNRIYMYLFGQRKGEHVRTLQKNDILVLVKKQPDEKGRAFRESLVFATRLGLMERSGWNSYWDDWLVPL